ncbi:MAG TPA: extracellular solute-binding protein [Candidatus Binatia bacterium]|jgi:ABC-type Fe3+ transport system substrate-binding protein
MLDSARRNRRTAWRAATLVLLLLGFVDSGSAQTDWKAEWNKTLAAAKKEGRLNLYVGRYGQAPLLAEFAKEFPEIKLVTVNGTGNQLGTRILAEVRSSKVIADLYSGGANSSHTLLYRGKVLDAFPTTLILPEVVDESKWYSGKHVYTDVEGKYIFVYIANPGGGSISYNTDLVNPKEFRSYWDLLQLKWKGKIGSQPLTETGLGATLQFFFYHPEIGPEWIRRIYGTMHVTFGDRRLIVDWLAKGKLALCVGCREVERAKAQGLPVARFDDGTWKEGQGLSTGGGSMSLIKGAPHPNAAKVFINWFLSRQGQIALQSSNDLYGEPPPNSRRIDIPKDMLAPDDRLVEGRKYVDVSRSEYADMTPIFKLAKDIMKTIEQK